MIKLCALKLVHFIITVAQFAFSTCIWLHCLLKDVRASAFGGQNVTLYSVRLDARYLTKIPDHVAMVVGEDVISYNDLADMIFWALALGVSFISLYDRKGLILRNEGVLRKAIERKTLQYVGSAEKETSFGSRCQIDIHRMGRDDDDDGGKDGQAGLKNGFHEAPLRGHVLLLDESDGHGGLASRARELCRRALAGAGENSTTADGEEKLDPGSIDEKSFDRFSREKSGFPDPHLALNFGSTPGLLGYPPWETRLTEVVAVPTHKNIDYRRFFTALSQYANCNQRLGK